MLVEMTYTDYAANFACGKEMLEEFTPETLEKIDEYFEELGETITESSSLNPDNFYVNVLTIFNEEDLEDYGFTPEQVKTAYEGTTHNPAPWLRGTSAHEALEEVNPEAYEALVGNYIIFGWNNNGSLVLM